MAFALWLLKQHRETADDSPERRARTMLGACVPNRIVRGDLLDSERYWSVSMEAREFYRHLQLVADDFGCTSMAPLVVGRRCFDVRPSNSKLAALTTELIDADLIRVYDNGRHAFIPRFGQQLKRFYLKHPKPPPKLYEDDDHATQQFNRIKEIVKNPVEKNTVRTLEAKAKRSEGEVEEEGEGEGEAKGNEAPVDNLTIPVDNLVAQLRHHSIDVSGKHRDAVDRIARFPLSAIAEAIKDAKKTKPGASIGATYIAAKLRGWAQDARQGKSSESAGKVRAMRDILSGRPA